MGTDYDIKSLLNELHRIQLAILGTCDVSIIVFKNGAVTFSVENKTGSSWLFSPRDSDKDTENTLAEIKTKLGVK